VSKGKAGFRRFLAPRTFSQQRKLDAYREQARARRSATPAAATPPPPPPPRKARALSPKGALEGEAGRCAPPPLPEAKESCSVETPPSRPPQPAAPSAEPVLSAASADGPAARTQDEWAFEAFVAFETLCGNADRIAERIEEARAYEPDDTPPEYV
jgi:hypothetical protein